MVYFFIGAQSLVQLWIQTCIQSLPPNPRKTEISRCSNRVFDSLQKFGRGKFLTFLKVDKLLNTYKKVFKNYMMMHFLNWSSKSRATLDTDLATFDTDL